MLQGSKLFIFVVDQVAIDVARFWALCFCCWLSCSINTNFHINVAKFWAFCFCCGTNHVININFHIDVVGFWAFLLLPIKLQQLSYVLWAFGHSTMLLIKLHQLVRWVGWSVFVSVFLQAACFVVGRFFYRTGVQSHHKLLDFQE